MWSVSRNLWRQFWSLWTKERVDGDRVCLILYTIVWHHHVLFSTHGRPFRLSNVSAFLSHPHCLFVCADRISESLPPYATLNTLLRHSHCFISLFFIAIISKQNFYVIPYDVTLSATYCDHILLAEIYFNINLQINHLNNICSYKYPLFASGIMPRSKY